MSASEFEGHEALVAQLRAGTLDAPGHLHRRVLAGAPATRRRIASMSARRRFFVAVPVAASLAVVAAVVNGVFLSSSSRPTPFNAAERVQRANGGYPTLPPLAGAAGVPGPTGPKGPTGATGATGLQGPTGAAGLTGANGVTGVTGAYASPRRSVVHGTADFGLHTNGSNAPTGAQGPTGPTALQGVNPLGRYSSYPSYSEMKLGVALPATIDRAGKDIFNTDALAIPAGRLVHAEATLVVSVADHDALTKATNQATQIVTALGGYSQSVQYAASQKGYGRSFLDLRVPLGKTELAIQKLGQLGDLTSQTVSTQDLERQATQQTNQIDRLRRAIKIYRQALLSGTLTGAQRIQVQIQLANARYELKATRKAHSHTVTSGRTANIRLTLQTAQHAAVGPHKTGRLGRMLHNIGQFLAVEAIAVLYVLIVGLPIILLVALIWWFTRGRRQRDERRLLASEA